MTIRVDITARDAMAELIAHVRAGEEVMLISDESVVAIVTLPPPATQSATKGPRKLGVWEHLNLNIPAEVFTDPDPELEALMEDSIWPEE